MTDYFRFQGEKSTDKGIVLKDYNLIFLAANRIDYKEVPGRDGSLEGPTKGKSDVIINCEVSILGEDLVEAIEAANQWLDQRGELSFWNMEDKYYTARPTGEITVKDEEAWGDFIIQFRCTPYKTAVTERTAQLGQTITREGNHETVGKITIDLTAATTEVIVKLEGTQEKIRIIDSFESGDQIEIDLEQETARRNGNLIMGKLDFESDFFKLPTGQFKVTTSKGSGQIKFRERWR